MNAKFYVPFETAKLLKEKGYPQRNSDMYYDPNGKLMTNRELLVGYKEDYPIMVERYYYAAPAYCEVLDWLVEKGLYIAIDSTSKCRWYCDIWDSKRDTMVDSTCEFLTGEQAINEAIVKALENNKS